MKQAEESTDIRLIIKCLFVRTLQEVNYLQLWCTRLGNLRFGLLHSDRKFDSNPCHSLCHKSSTCWRSIPFSCCHRYLLFPSVSSNVHEFSCHNTLAKILYRQDLKNKIHPSHKQYVSKRLEYLGNIIDYKNRYFKSRPLHVELHSSIMLWEESPNPWQVFLTSGKATSEMSVQWIHVFESQNPALPHVVELLHSVYIYHM